MASVCIHDNRMVCGSTPDGCSRRRFLDQCDMYEYNCDYGTRYSETYILYCTWPSLDPSLTEKPNGFTGNTDLETKITDLTKISKATPTVILSKTTLTTNQRKPSVITITKQMAASELTTKAFKTESTTKATTKTSSQIITAKASTSDLVIPTETTQVQKERDTVCCHRPKTWETTTEEVKYTDVDFLTLVPEYTTLERPIVIETIKPSSTDSDLTKHSNASKNILNTTPVTGGSTKMILQHTDTITSKIIATIYTISNTTNTNKIIPTMYTEYNISGSTNMDSTHSSTTEFGKTKYTESTVCCNRPETWETTMESVFEVSKQLVNHESDITAMSPETTTVSKLSTKEGKLLTTKPRTSIKITKKHLDVEEMSTLSVSSTTVSKQILIKTTKRIPTIISLLPKKKRLSKKTLYLTKTFFKNLVGSTPQFPILCKTKNCERPVTWETTQRRRRLG